MIRRILLIAQRDYLTSVLTKAYLFGLIVLPVVMGASLLGVALVNRGNAKEQHVALIDRTGVAGALVIQAAEERNRAQMFEPVTGRQIMGRYIFEQIEPEPDQAAQLLLLSRRIRTGDLSLLIDIAPGALRPRENSQQDLVRLYTNSAALGQSNAWLSAAVNDGLRRARLTQLGVDPAQLPDALSDVSLTPMSLASEDAKTGKIEEGIKRNPVQSVLLPVVMMVLLMMIVLLGSAQKLGAIAEDKMQRVFEMLLSSASPFELMMGKVLGALGVSLTSSIFYISGGLPGRWQDWPSSDLRPCICCPGSLSTWSPTSGCWPQWARRWEPRAGLRRTLRAWSCSCSRRSWSRCSC